MPNDKDAREKFEATKKENTLRRFASALDYGEKKVEVNINDITVESSYTGPRLDNGIEDINAEWVVSVMDYLKG